MYPVICPSPEQELCTVYKLILILVYSVHSTPIHHYHRMILTCLRLNP
uniref:Uncharacterized protein n=1 Tax=Anguilla anguilla TaxID=7936 RepID=A0A0E9WAN0_ANGAN